MVYFTLERKSFLLHIQQKKKKKKQHYLNERTIVKKKSNFFRVFLSFIHKLPGNGLDTTTLNTQNVCSLVFLKIHQAYITKHLMK